MSYKIIIKTMMLMIWYHIASSQTLDYIDHKFTDNNRGLSDVPIQINIDNQNIPGYNFNSLLTIQYAVLDAFPTNDNMYLVINITNPQYMGILRDGNGNIIDFDYNQTYFQYIPDNSNPNILRFKIISTNFPSNTNLYFSMRVHIKLPSPSAPVTLAQTFTSGFGSNANQNSITYLIDAQPLPITFLSFNAEKLEHKQHSLLTWETLTNADVIQYEIEHSVDALNWHNIGNVLANSTTEKTDFTTSYEHIHTTPEKGKNFYRLKIAAINETVSYSEVRELVFNSNSNNKIYPNPNNGIFFINTEFQSTYSIFNATGQPIETGNIDSNTSAEINLQHLSKGIYTIQIKSNAKTESHKVNIQ